MLTIATKRIAKPKPAVAYAAFSGGANSLIAAKMTRIAGAERIVTRPPMVWTKGGGGKTKP